MASMVEPAELSGCVGLGADAVVVGVEVVSATKPESEELVRPNPLALTSGDLWPSVELEGGPVVAEPAEKSGSATDNKRD